MVIGNGLIANAFSEFKNIDNIIIFASGVSNSLETNEKEFEREVDLLKSCDYNKKLIYFSSVNLFEDRDYFRHKKNMEKTIKSLFNDYLIIRISQLIGNGGNENNLFNYFKNSIINETEITINKNAYRSLIDVDDLVEITKVLAYYRGTLNFSHIESVTALRLYNLISEKLNKTTKTNIEDGLEGYLIKNSPQINFAMEVTKLDIIGYTKKIIDKYL